MEDEASILLDGKALGNLRVVDLKQELEKRGLSKSGSKKDLVKRLKQQLEFEKLCGERKSTGDCDLKLELDADTEQNEFVQQYLAQQQKIYAEQKEVKRLIELEEIQKSGDERGTDSAKDTSDQEESSEDDSEQKTLIKPENFKRISKESKEETDEENTRELSSENAKNTENIELKGDEINESGAISRRKELSSDKDAKNAETIESEAISSIRDCKVEHIISVDIKGKESRIIVKGTSCVNIDDREECKKEETQAVNIEDESRSRLDKIKDESVEESRVENIKDESTKEPRVEGIKEENVDRSKVEIVKDEIVDKSRGKTIKDEIELSRVENVKDEIEVSRVENIKHKIEVSKVESIKHEIEVSGVENVKDEIEMCRVKNVTYENVQESMGDDIKREHVKRFKVENFKVEMEVCIDESIKGECVAECRTENVKDESMKSTTVKSIETKGLKCSVVKVIGKLETETTVDEVCKKQKSVDNIKDKKLSERKSIEETSDIVKTSDTLELSEAGGQNQELNMEPAAEVSSVPLSDIQLPESPGKPMKPISKSVLEEQPITQSSSQSESHANGSSSSNEKSSEIQTSTVNGESPRKKENHLKEQEESSRGCHKKEKFSEGSEEGEMKSSSEESSDSNERRRRKVKRKKDRRSKDDSSDSRESSQDQLEPISKEEPPKQRLKLKRDNVESSHVKVSEDNSRKNSDELAKPETSKPPETQPVYISTRKIRLSSSKLKADAEPKSKRGKWGNFSQKTSQCISISTDSLKNMFPDFKLLKSQESVSEVDEFLPVAKESKDPMPQQMDESSSKEEPKEAEQVDDGVTSNILFIQNLVRPFTLLQLKELLKETGNFIEEKFWIDKIKSKCFVVYETEEEAVKTRNVLNGSRWPSSNPKILSVEFSNDENLQFHQSEAPKPTLPPPPIEKLDPRDDRTSQSDSRPKEKDHRRERTKLPIREWDKNKLTQESPTRERTNRSAEKTSDKRKEAKRRPNEDTPAKLLDDLFQKTKSSPCIYWLPLTEEQVVERKETQRLRRAERDKRIQQREQEENKSKNVQPRNRTRETETRRSSTRSRSPRRR